MTDEQVCIHTVMLKGQPLLQLLQGKDSDASLAPAQPDAEITEQAVSAMPAWHAYRAGLRQKGYFKVAFCFACVLAEPLQLLPGQFPRALRSVCNLQHLYTSRVHNAFWDRAEVAGG